MTIFKIKITLKSLEKFVGDNSRGEVAVSCQGVSRQHCFLVSSSQVSVCFSLLSINAPLEECLETFSPPDHF